MTVEVGVRELRSRLRHWLDRAEAGDELIVTERGRPVARIMGVGHKTTLQRLIDEGLVIPARKPKRSWLPKPIDVPGGISDILRDSRGRY